MARTKHHKEIADPSRRTAASAHRVEALRNLGPRIQAEIGNSLQYPNLRIAITPLGSCLKGYAAEDSDVEYAISFLDGFQGEGGLAGGVLPQDFRLGEQVYGIADRCLTSLGLRPDSFGTGTLVHIFIYQELLNTASSSTEIFELCDEATCPFWISRLLLPAAFGEEALLGKPKKRIFLFLEMLYKRDEVRAKSLWEAVRSEYYDTNWGIDESDIEIKPHLKTWLRLQHVNVRSRASFRRFLVRWRKRVGLPGFEKVCPAAAQLNIAKNLGFL